MSSFSTDDTPISHRRREHGKPLTASCMYCCHKAQCTLVSRQSYHLWLTYCLCRFFFGHAPMLSSRMKEPNQYFSKVLFDWYVHNCWKWTYMYCIAMSLCSNTLIVLNSNNATEWTLIVAMFIYTHDNFYVWWHKPSDTSDTSRTAQVVYGQALAMRNLWTINKPD